MAGPSHYDPNTHHRRSIRLQGYDYSQAGAYFITVCTQNRINLFGDFGNVGDEWISGQAGFVRAGLEPAPTGRIRLNEYGETVQNTWNDLIDHVSGIELGEFVVMPNHIHGIIMIVGTDSVGAGSKPALRPPIAQQPLSEIIRQFKTFSARWINEKRNTPGAPVWQRNYFEHVIRSKESHDKIAAYIANNPEQWESDKLFNRDNP